MKNPVLIFLLIALSAAGAGSTVTYLIMTRNVGDIEQIKLENEVFQQMITTQRNKYSDSLKISSLRQEEISRELHSVREQLDSISQLSNIERARLEKELKRLKNSTVKQLENEAELVYRNAIADSTKQLRPN